MIYKLESYNLFKNMVDMMNRKTAAVLMRGQIPVREEPTEEEKQAMAVRQAAMEEAARQRIAIQRAEAERHQDMSKYRTEKTDISVTTIRKNVPSNNRARNQFAPKNA